MDIPVSFEGTAGYYLVVGFALSILFWVVRYYFYILFGAKEGYYERQLKGMLLDNVVVFFIAVVLVVSLSYISSLNLPGLTSSSAGAGVSVGAYNSLLADLEALTDRLRNLMTAQAQIVESSAIPYGLTISIMSFPIFTGSDSPTADRAVKAQAFYFLLLDLYMLVKVTYYLLSIMGVYGPWLILYGAVVRAFPGVKPFGGFLMALGVALALYPVFFVLFFNTPTLPSMGQLPLPTFCDIPGFSPITLPAEGSGALLFSTLPLSSSVEEVIRELYVVFLLRHIISVAIGLQILRVGSIILSGQTLLTSAFERRLLGAI